MPDTVQRICYLEDAALGQEVLPTFHVLELSEGKAKTGWRRWVGPLAGPQRLVYQERCRLSWDDLELVSFVPQGSSRGTVCWCDLSLRLDDPLQLLDELGDSLDGRRAVTRHALDAWFRQRVAEILERLGGRGDLSSDAYWPTVAAEVAKLQCPRGVALDHSGVLEQSAFVLRKVLSFEQYIEVTTRVKDFQARIARVLADGSLVLAAAQGRLAPFLKEMGEDQVADILTPMERARPAEQRVSSYIEILGAASESALRSGVVIGGFQLQSKLGRGGMGEVWKAWDTKAGRPVVVKLVPPELQHADEAMARVRSAFLRTHALHHEHICPVHLLDEDRRFGWYVVMDYVAGQTLSAYRADHMARHGSFPLAQVVQLLRPVAEALDYAHRQKVIHRDVKPENILVLDQGKDVQVIDFGLAAEIRTSVSSMSQVRMEISGARPYMAPEQWLGYYQDHRTDQYALAVVAYEMLAGCLPFETTDFEILKNCVLTVPPPSIEDAPQEVNQALLKGLAKRREERFRSCVELIDAIGRSVLPALAEIRALSSDFCRGTKSTRQTHAQDVKKLAPGIDLDSILSFCTTKTRGERVAGFIALGARLAAGLSPRNTDRVIAVLKRGVQDPYLRARYQAVKAVLAAPEIATQCGDVLAIRRTKETHKTIRGLIQKDIGSGRTQTTKPQSATPTQRIAGQKDEHHELDRLVTRLEAIGRDQLGLFTKQLEQLKATQGKGGT